MIILGYRGIGKTTYASKHDKAIDLDYMGRYLISCSSNKYNIAYISLDAAALLSDQGYTVLVPWTREIQDVIIHSKYQLDREFIIIYPTKGILDKVKTFCHEIPESVSFDFLTDIDMIRSAPDNIFIKVELTDIDYDLEKIISGLKVMEDIRGELEGAGKNVSENRNENT